MTISPRQLIGNVIRFGSGDVVGRVFSITTVMLLGHFQGVVVLGIYSLAQSISQYLQPVIDFGLRHVGARLMARFPGSASEIMHRVQRRRLGMAAAVVPFALLYASLSRLPLEMKVFLFVFSAISCMYALSLDWAAWGREQLRLVGLAKAIVPGCLLLCLLLGFGSRRLLAWLVLGNFAGYSLQAIVFRLWWKRHQREIGDQKPAVAAITESLAWRSTSIMGLAWLGNLAFVTIDMLMLGIMSGPGQVGLYSAAYRIMSQVLLTYYLLTNVLYPQLARQTVSERVRMMRPRILLALFAVGSALAGLVVVVRRPALSILFGHDFVAAAPLLLVLAFAIPLDFLVSYLNSAYIAWSMERKVLVCVVVAAASNIVLNWFGIPRYGAMAAAVNTVISYAIYLAGLVIAGNKAKNLQHATTQILDNDNSNGPGGASEW
ncbi:MAG TPA: polysaccharide biosynthesis C-terminal domain-containing protein [Candidatus Methylomirabilis sp.]|nr:polysaccharide biosynthesis C-terminal domain-containing protein [Candidatus Methylomirabilis sp.]